MNDVYDVVIVGGGPAGLSAALALGRARRRVLVCDAGPRRNERAHAVQNFVTRDGTPPTEFRRIAREQLAQYETVEFLDESVRTITPQGATFDVEVGARHITARRVLLCTGLIDESLPIDGFDDLWGQSIFQCPYCHGWERRDQRWGYLATTADSHHFELLLRHWTQQVTLFTQGAFALNAERVELLRTRGIEVETRPIAQLLRAPGEEPVLRAVRFHDGEERACDVLFVHPKQKATELVQSLGLAHDEHGFVVVDPMTRQTSLPGVYAAGDVTTRAQAAIFAAASGTQAAAAINHALVAP